MADYITIDNDLRQITFPESLQVLGVEHDKETHKLLFEMPATFGDFDLSEFSFYINYRNPLGEIAKYEISDISTKKELINGVVTSKLTFSWLVGEEAFRAAGIGQFVVCLKLYDDNGYILQEFNTELTNLPPVLEGLELPNDGENLIIIDNDLRTIKIPDSLKIIGVENDDSVHRLYFRMPATLSGEDLFTDCIFYINYKNVPDNSEDSEMYSRYIIDDAELSEDGKYIYFSWLVGRNAFVHQGVVKFVVCIQRIDSDVSDIAVEIDPAVEVLAEYNTTVSSLIVLEGLECTTFSSSPYYDVITSYLALLRCLMELYNIIKPAYDGGYLICEPISRRYFGVCNTDADVVAKIVDVQDESFRYEEGIYLDVWFKYENSQDEFTLGASITVTEEEEPEPEPDNPEVKDDECNDPDVDLNGYPNVKVSQVSDLMTAIEEVSTDVKYDTSNVDYTVTYDAYPVYYTSTDDYENEKFRVGAYRWEAGEIVTFRYWDKFWIMEQRFSIGYDGSAYGRYSNNFGHGNNADNYGATLVGEYADISGDSTSRNSRIDDNIAFAVGNGTSNSKRKNALTVTWAGDTTVQNGLAVGSDITINNESVLDTFEDLQDQIDENYKNSVHATTAPLGSDSQFIYLNSTGALVEASETIGDASTPIYLNDGVFTAISSVLYNYLNFKIVDELPDIYDSSQDSEPDSDSDSDNDDDDDDNDNEDVPEDTPIYAEEMTIYSIPDPDAEEGSDNSRIEYILINDQWELFGGVSAQQMKDAIQKAGHLTYVCVDELPDISEAEENVIYAVPDPDAGVTEDGIWNRRIEYILVEGEWEIWGSSSVDLSNYISQDQINTVATYGDLKGKHVLVWDETSGFTAPGINDLEEYLNNYLKDYLMKT